LPKGEQPFLYLLYLAGFSEALFLALMRHPGQLQGLAAQVRGARSPSREALEESLARFLLGRRWSTPAEAMAAFRSIQTARILLQDVLGILPFDAVTRELSYLADVLIAKAFALSFQPLRESLGLPMFVGPEGRAVSCSLSVFALGKLGGEELNYASDVDLVFLYQSDGRTDRGHPNGAFFKAWVQAATALLTTPTPDGSCLRVDANLRPRGRDGELALPFASALAYYREWADLWERQAWVKARVCAGDASAGALFLRDLEPLIYQPYSFAGLARQNRQMRERALARLRRTAPDGPEADVKEGRGGIRDAEFSVQALQMAYGQKDRWVREGGTLRAVEKLHQKGLLTASQRAALSGAYVLLRRAEHWAQVQGMRQTHLLPKSEMQWRSLAAFLGQTEPGEAEADVASARKQAADLFRATLNRIERLDEAPRAYQELLSMEGMRSVLEAARIRDVDRALPLLSAVYSVLEPRLDSPARRQGFLRIHYSLLREFQTAPDPFQGLSNLHKVVACLSSEPWAAQALLDQPRLARLLFRLISRSEPMLQAVLRWPHLVRLLSYEVLQSAGDAAPPQSSGADEIRRWQKTAFFLAEAREMIMGEGLPWTQAVHTAVADAVCDHVFIRACSETERRERLTPGALSESVCLLGLGRLGFREMHPRSDLDLVCVKRGAWVLPDDPDRSALVEAKFARALVEAFTAVTRHGALYDLDFRLRPYGGSGPQVQSSGALEEYFRGPARPWERLSYLKGRPVAGAAKLGREVLAAVWTQVRRAGLPAAELQGLLELRQRLEAGAHDLGEILKFAPGGLLHLDLLLLALQVRSGLEPGEGGTLGLIGRLGEAGALSPSLCGALHRSRLFQDTLLHRCRLHFERAPLRGRKGAAFRQLGLLWQASPQGGKEAPPPDRLQFLWNDHRQAVLSAWDELL
jgi:glutamate-ammonia-ligase adenylyltransferase